MIVDPYMGSGASLIAARQLGISAIGIELSEGYCAAAVERLNKEPNLFGPKYPESKVCPGCRRRIKVIVGTTFNRKSATTDGLQPWCRECDARNKLGAQNGWKNFRRMLVERRSGEERMWSRKSYEEMMGNFTCWYCGNDVTEWSQGYWVDKQSASRGYEPSNCVPCCKPCNFEKCNRNSEAWHNMIQNLLKRYPRGRVPWNEISPKWVHTSSSVPKLSDYVVESDVSDSDQLIMSFDDRGSKSNKAAE